MQNLLSWLVQNIKILRGHWIRNKKKQLRMCEIWLHELGLKEIEDFCMKFDV